MEQDTPHDVDTSLAAHAFGELRAEISLLRRAVERLTDERIAQPDYAPSLEAVGKRLEDVCAWARRVSEKPALQLTPESLGREITEAAANSREQDQQALERAASAMEAAGARIDAMIARSRSVAEQNREVLHNRVAFAVAGMVLFAILPGMIARSLPVSWAVPERIAARTVGTDMWHAGQQMMKKADPERWGQLVAHEQEQADPAHR
ncbi:MAG: DUF6118 family protein [Candidatus Sphingomonas phytovorans]|nr:DUF6118 family protein [Sphingomonas sp.]WEJ99476.1 MAG: DUF6118 family protein [Sphingomonas sp.]